MKGRQIRGGSPQDKFKPFFCLVGLGFCKLGVHLVVTGERIWHSMKETASPVVSSLSINLIELLLSLYIFSFFGGGVSQILKESGPQLLRRHFLVPTVHEFLLHLSL